MSNKRVRPSLTLLGLVLCGACGDDSAPGGGGGSGSTSADSDDGSGTTEATGASMSASGASASGSASGTGGTDDGTTGTTTGEGESSGTDTDGETLVVDCGTPPASAVGATYSHLVAASGGTGSYTFMATGLPAGLGINPVTGEIGGIPTEEGSFDVTVDVRSGGNPPPTGSTTCPIEVAPALTWDSELVAPCVMPGDSVANYVTGGDGSPLRCTTPDGWGDGTVPAGVTVDQDTCENAGAITETRYGTWGFIVEVEQSGAKTWVPYCATQSTVAPGKLPVEVGFAVDPATDRALVPLTVDYVAGDPITIGAAMDPQFRILGGCAPDVCFFGYLYAITASPFDDGTVALAPAALLTDGAGDDIGFSHELHLDAPMVESMPAGRPIAVSLDFDYCVTDTDGPCTGATNIRANGNAELHYTLLLMPG